jgi:hypothetical protein
MCIRRRRRSGAKRRGEEYKQRLYVKTLFTTRI